LKERSVSLDSTRIDLRVFCVTCAVCRFTGKLRDIVHARPLIRQLKKIEYATLGQTTATTQKAAQRRFFLLRGPGPAVDDGARTIP